MGALPTMQTAVLDIAHLLGISAGKHLVDESIIVASIVAGIPSFKPAPVLGKERQTGRPRLKGKRRRTLEAVLADSKTPWMTLKVIQWFGVGPREVEVGTDTAIWYHSGKPPVPIRWVLIRDPQG